MNLYLLDAVESYNRNFNFFLLSLELEKAGFVNEKNHIMK